MEYRELEKLFYSYKDIKKNIEINKTILESLKNEDGIKGIAYKETSSKTNKIYSITENAAIDNIEKEKQIKRWIIRDESKIKIMDNLLNSVDEVERKIIELYYIENWPWWKVAQEVCYSETWCKEKRNRIMEELLSLIGE